MMRTINLAVFFAYGALLAYLSLQQPDELVISAPDKISHLLAYGGFAFLGYRLETTRAVFWAICIGVVAYSGLLEYAQSFVPGRMMSFLDMVANAMGVLLAALACEVFFGHLPGGSTND